MTIVDACLTVLRQKKGTMTADQIYDEIVRQRLYPFKAKDPKSVLRSALRRHLRSPGPHRLRQAEPGAFVADA